jgi:hypothetical protein
MKGPTGGRNVSEEQLKLLKKKGVFPYEYKTDFSKLSVTSLPKKEEFHSKLSNTDISDEDYAHAQKVWKSFGCKTMKDYQELYLKTDVFLLADVMNNFRKLCRKEYGLEPLYYYTAPGLSWDAMQKHTKEELELITDPDMFQMLEKGKRGGVSTITNRFAESNHKYLSDYNPNKKSKHIVYLDVMVGGQCVENYHPKISDGWWKASWRAGNQCHAFSKSTWSIRKNFTTCTMITHWHQRK